MKLYRLSHRCLPLFIAITPLNKVTIIIKVLKQSMCDKLIGNLFQHPNDLLNSFFTHLLGLISTRDITAYKVTLQQLFQTSLVSYTDQDILQCKQLFYISFSTFFLGFILIRNIFQPIRSIFNSSFTRLFCFNMIRDIAQLPQVCLFALMHIYCVLS